MITPLILLRVLCLFYLATVFLNKKFLSGLSPFSCCNYYDAYCLPFYKLPEPCDWTIEKKTKR